MAESTNRNRFSGSVGAGMRSVFSPGQRTFYVLEHKMTSPGHKAGDKQEIIIDYIELGRAAGCQVRFDESCHTVSRRHAAILRDGNNWKLRQLSQTNDTLINGRPVKNEWYLQNGDEIQLSVGGPKLGFLLPAKNTMGSIGLSRRLSLFRQQALLPYRKAIIAMAACIAVLLIGGVTWGIIAHEHISQQEQLITQLTGKLDSNTHSLDSLQQKLHDTEEAIKNGTINASGGPIPNEMIQQCLKDIYFLYCYKVTFSYNGETRTVPKYGWGGTAFLLDDGRLVTARHCVFGWNYPSEETGMALSRLENMGATITGYYKAISPDGTVLELTSRDFVNNHCVDVVTSDNLDDEGNLIVLNMGRLDDSDWSYTKTSRTGSIKAATELSANIPMGTNLAIIGYPQFIGVDFEAGQVTPQYNVVTTSENGLDSQSRTIRVSNNVDHGNSGGPALMMQDDAVVAVGIASRGDLQSEKYAHYVPIASIYR